jgi:uncharacterized phage protein (TIGR02220 family)
VAERRMVSKTVTQTQKFLRLPLEAQALYFHLILNSDDDGIVEAFPVVRMIGSSEDSLGLLVIKQFIKPLGEDMVYFITDFNEQNKIRPDRHKPSIHRDLAVEKLGLEVDGNRLIDTTKTASPKALPSCQTGDGQVTDECPHSIGKDSIVEYSIGKDSAEQSPPYEEIISYLNQKLGTKYSHTSRDTKKHIQARFRDGFTLDDFKHVIDVKVSEWGNDSKMSSYLRPKTLFGTKFESYLNQKLPNGFQKQADVVDERLGF